MNKTLIIVGIISGVVVVSCAVGGAMLAINIQSSNVEDIVPTASAIEVKEKLNGWKQEGSDWCYYNDDKEQTGWFQDNNKWYYLGNDGKMRTGWIQDNTNWYYLNADGTMATNITVDGCYLNEKGLIQETPKPQSSEKTNDIKESNKSGHSVTNQNEAMDIIYNNDSLGYQLVCQGMFSQEKINDELRKYFEGFQLNESAYVFYVYDNESGDVGYIYYVGKDTGTVYRRDGGYHSLDNAYMLKNKQIVKVYHWKQ